MQPDVMLPANCCNLFEGIYRPGVGGAGRGDHANHILLLLQRFTEKVDSHAEFVVGVDGDYAIGTEPEDSRDGFDREVGRRGAENHGFRFFVNREQTLLAVSGAAMFCQCAGDSRQVGQGTAAEQNAFGL